VTDVCDKLYSRFEIRAPRSVVDDVDVARTERTKRLMRASLLSLCTRAMRVTKTMQSNETIVYVYVNGMSICSPDSIEIHRSPFSASRVIILYCCHKMKTSSAFGSRLTFLKFDIKFFDLYIKYI